MPLFPAIQATAFQNTSHNQYNEYIILLCQARLQLQMPIIGIFAKIKQCEMAIRRFVNMNTNNYWNSSINVLVDELKTRNIKKNRPMDG